MTERVAVAAVQIAPVFLDLEASVAKACHWIAEAGRQGLQLLVFPETWLPGYPAWVDYSPHVGLWDHPPAKEIFRRLYENSPEIPSPTTERLCAAAAEARLTVAIGLHERSGGTLYNTLLYISDRGRILGLHRKLIPTYTERLIWGQGDGSTLAAVDASFGVFGGLICWEHWMPLARQAMHQQQEAVHAAVWPAVKETHLLASRAYAFEGRCFVIAAGALLSREHLPAGLDLLDEMPGDGPWLNGGSAVIGPDAQVIAGPAGPEESLVAAQIDLGRVVEEKMTLDVAGHYARPDVFDFRVKP